MRFLKSQCPSCGKTVEYAAEAIGKEISCPWCIKPVIMRRPVPAKSSGTTAIPEEKRSRVPLSQLTEVTIRNRTKSGSTPLHRAAKNGKLGEIPLYLLHLQLFMERNDSEETPLHIAAKHGHLNQVPPEFLTLQTLKALDYYGRTPLHVAADYRHVDQIPQKFLIPEILKLPTKNYRSETILHLAAATNTLCLLPRDCLTPELLQIKNGYGMTPLDLYVDHLPTEKQLTRLRKLGIIFDESGLTREIADTLLEDYEEQQKPAKDATLRLHYIKSDSSNLPNQTYPAARITLLAKSSSGKDPYNVEFVADGPSVRVFCHCPAGRKKWVCKHILGLARGASDMLFGSEQGAKFEQLKSWPQYPELRKRTETFLMELARIDETIIDEDSQFSDWYAARRVEEKPPDEKALFFGLSLPGLDEDLAARKRCEEIEEAKAALRKKARSLKEEFVRGLTLGFHRI